MTTDTTSALTLHYEGSVKRVWEPPKPEELWFEFTDDYSVFDWGKMPDTIANKGRSLTVLGAWFFEHLAEPGFWQTLKASLHLRRFDAAFLQELTASRVFSDLTTLGCQTHYLGLYDSSGARVSLAQTAGDKGRTFMAVKKAQVLRPSPHVLFNQTVFAYPDRNEYSDCRLVPLEVVFRFGMPAGSSLKARLERDPAYARTLGLTKTPAPESFFERPVIELYTKLEPKDRLLSVQEALLLSGLVPEQMKELSDTAMCMALALYVIFAEKGIELWDGKFEFVLADGQLLAADSIGPDELRLIYKGCHLSKEMIRQVYRGTDWEKALKPAQQLASERNSLDWKNICSEELKQVPERFTEPIRLTVDKLYGTLTNHVAGELFAGQPTLDQFVGMVADLETARGAQP